MSGKIKNLELVSFGRKDDKTVAEYKINGSETLKLSYPLKLTYTQYVVNDGYINDKGDKGSNGFRLVKNRFGQFIYIRKKSNVQMPFLFDYATDFNKDGLAMVAKDGCVTWINKNFEYFSRDGSTKTLSENYNIEGWYSVSDFSGNGPLFSRCQTGINNKPYTIFLGTNFESKEFYLNNGVNIVKNAFYTRFDGIFSDFDEDGYAFKDDQSLILSTVGYFMGSDTLIERATKERKTDLIEAAIGSGVLNTINNEAKDSKVFEKIKD